MPVDTHIMFILKIYRNTAHNILRASKYNYMILIAVTVLHTVTFGSKFVIGYVVTTTENS